MLSTRLQFAMPRLARPLCGAPRTPHEVTGGTGTGSGLGAADSAEDITVLKLYRDCMRLTYHIAANSAKGQAMRAMVRSSFRAQMHVTDPAEIQRLKMLGVVGLQNYVIHEQTGKAISKRSKR